MKNVHIFAICQGFGSVLSWFWQFTSVTRGGIIKVGKVNARREAVQAFYSTRVWRMAREAYRSKKIFCERCGDVGTQVHHKKRLTFENMNDPMIALDSSNLMLLCDACHEKEHGKHRRRADAMGHVELTPPSCDL